MKKCIGIYLRLSLEDVDKRTNKAKDESNSIVAQRQLIQRHIEQNPYLSNLAQMEFCDDGFSGTNFERPDFQRMIDLIRAGEIHIVIVKDLLVLVVTTLIPADTLRRFFRPWASVLLPSTTTTTLHSLSRQATKSFFRSRT